MHINWAMLFNIDLDLEVWKLVNLLLVGSPIEFVPPLGPALGILALNDTSSCTYVVDEAFHVARWSTIVPAWVVLELGGKLCLVKSPHQSVDLLLRNVDLVLFDLGHCDGIWIRNMLKLSFD